MLVLAALVVILIVVMLTYLMKRFHIIKAKMLHISVDQLSQVKLVHQVYVLITWFLRMF